MDQIDNYETKIEHYLNSLKAFENSEKFNKEKIKEFINILYDAYKKLKTENNDSEKYCYMDNSFLDQVIRIIKTKLKYNFDDIKKCFNIVEEVFLDIL